MAEQRTCGIILARAGSKGLAGKNALLVAGRPMLAWTIDHARQSLRLNRIALSTDGEALATIGRECGIHVIERPGELADDTATVDAAARHAVTVLEDQGGQRFSHVIILYGNVPVRPVDLIDRALDKLIDSQCDSVQSICNVEKMHPYWMRTLGGEDGDQLGLYQSNQVYRRQDLPPVYMLDGGVIAVTRESLFNVQPGQPHGFLGSDQRAIVTHPGEVIDVDNDIDRHVAEAILESRQIPVDTNGNG